MNHHFDPRMQDPDAVFIHAENGADMLTLHKLKATLDQSPDMAVTGFILMDKKTGERTLTELSAVRRVSKDAMWELMHPSGQPTGLSPKDAP